MPKSKRQKGNVKMILDLETIGYYLYMEQAEREEKTRSRSADDEDQEKETIDCGKAN
jgi:hypothetical protein